MMHFGMGLFCCRKRWCFKQSVDCRSIKNGIICCEEVKPYPSEVDLDWVKCNLDGAWIQQGLHGGFSVVLRDHMGEFIAAAGGIIGRTSFAFHAELFATRQAVLFALAYCPVGKIEVFEGDLIMVLVAMKG